MFFFYFFVRGPPPWIRKERYRIHNKLRRLYVVTKCHVALVLYVCVTCTCYISTLPVVFMSTGNHPSKKQY